MSSKENLRRSLVGFFFFIFNAPLAQIGFIKLRIQWQKVLYHFWGEILIIREYPNEFKKGFDLKIKDILGEIASELLRCY